MVWVLSAAPYHLGPTKTKSKTGSLFIFASDLATGHMLEARAKECETLCTHFLSCVTPNTNAQHLLISAISAHVLSFPSVAAACQRLSSNFAHRNHVISWVHTIIACLRCSSTPPPCQGGRAMLQSLMYHMLQVMFSTVFVLRIS